MSSYLKGLANKINGVEEKSSFIKELDINTLVPSQNNFYGIREIEELAASIKENGLMHNLVVRKKDDETYEIISGERRYRALKNLNYEKVPCQVKEINDLDAEIMLIQANVEQRELLPTEKMEGIKRLKAIYEQKKANGEQLPKGKTRDLIGQDMKLSGVQVGRYMKVEKDLSKPLKKKLDNGEITLTQATTLSSLDREEQKIIHEQIKNLDVKEAKEEVETLINGIKQPIANKKDKELLSEMYPKKVENRSSILGDKYLTKAKKKTDNEVNYITDVRQKLNKMLEYDSHPTVIINDSKFKVFFYKVEQVLILEREIRGNITGSVLNLYTKCINETDEIPGINEALFKGSAYKLNEGVYLYFSNYSNNMKRFYKRGLVEADDCEVTL